jgi:hypothetical protein
MPLVFQEVCMMQALLDTLMLPVILINSLLQMSGFGLIQPIPLKHSVLHHSRNLLEEVLVLISENSIIIYHQ